ncbi:MAG: tetratricopeptide repeat protein, partial [Alphaproteobacteria bacterium]
MKHITFVSLIVLIAAVSALLFSSKDNLGTLHNSGCSAEAEPLYKRFLAMSKMMGPAPGQKTSAELDDTMSCSLWLFKEGRYQEFIPIAEKAIRLAERELGRDHLDTVTLVNFLAVANDSEGKYTEAEALFKRVLTSREKMFGPKHLLVAHVLNNLGVLYRDQGKYA